MTAIENFSNNASIVPTSPINLKNHFDTLKTHFISEGYATTDHTTLPILSPPAPSNFNYEAPANGGLIP